MIVSFAADLIVQSRIDVAGRHYEVPIYHVSTRKAFFEALAATDSPLLVLIDLDVPEIDTLELVEAARAQTDARVVGFCSHVMGDLIRAARERGAHTVMANSMFATAVPGLVAEVAAKLSPSIVKESD